MLLPTDQIGLNRDCDSNAIINIDKNAFELYKQMRERNTKTIEFEQRLNKVDNDIAEIKQIFSNYNFKTQILVASVRHPMHVVEAAKIGADVVTLPPDVLGKMLKHPLTDNGLKAFLADWDKLQASQK